MDMLMRNKLAVRIVRRRSQIYKYKITNVCEAANSQGEIDALIKWQHSLGADCLRISRAITQLNPCRFLITLRECATVVSRAGSVPFVYCLVTI